MNKKDYLQNISNECIYDNSQKVAKAMNSLISSNDVKMAIIHFEDYYDPVWYASVGKELAIIPVFKNSYIYNYYTIGVQFYIEDISPGQYFFRHGELHYLDNKMKISKVVVCYTEEQACMFAKKFGINISNCSLIKLYSIGRTRDFITIIWLIDLDEDEMRIIVPVFNEDRKLLESYDLYDFDLEASSVGDFFIKDNRIWSIQQDKNNMLYIEKTILHIIPRQKS